MSEANWLDVKQAAERLGLSRSIVYQLAASGKLAHYKIGPNGGRIRFRPEDIAAYLEGCRVGGPAPPAPTPKRPRYQPKYDHSKPGSPPFRR
jgi:excisionase family DNA binding protein